MGVFLPPQASKRLCVSINLVSEIKIHSFTASCPFTFEHTIILFLVLTASFV